MVLADGAGTPLGVYLDSASPQEVKLLEKTLAAVQIKRKEGGRRRFRPDHLIADKGYDSDEARRMLRERGIEPVIPHRSNRVKPPTQDGRKLRMKPPAPADRFDGAGPTAAATVIFACVHNAGRSQMAAAFFNAHAHPSKARAVSAGTNPGERVHPEVVDAMLEVGIDLSKSRPRRLTADLAAGAQLLITMGCGDACPVVHGLNRGDWPLEDPKGKPIGRVREIRDEIHDRVRTLIESQGWQRQID